ncbi:MAG TPA: lamin tail domain-containing protein, partial [Candidatus Binatia bacterium]|nr:lamin tail domain-containing protein [Candidatus Binatia bacterium]
MPALAGLHLAAAPIPGLFNTGVGTNGALLANSAVDPHYRLIQSADAAAPGPNAFVVNDTLFPIVTGPWVANGPNSKWIAPQANQSSGNQPGDYKYRITFDLTGLEPSSAILTGRWTSDNGGPDVLLNDASTGLTSDGNFPVLGNPFTISAGFVDGINTLDFVVNNGAPGINPTGIRVELSGTADLQPPPGTPPSIVTPPSSVSVGLLDPATFSVGASGSRPFSYQWRMNGTAIAGANGSSFTIANARAADAGGYDVIVANLSGSATSSVATLTVVFLSPAQLSYEPLGPSSRHTGLAFSEIMYHPAPNADGRRTEFIELYNSNPFVEDISNWRLSGDIDYTFPSNTVIQGNGFLVVAPVPADVEAVYGIPGVLGGFTNSLPNDSGTLRLRKRSGGIVLEVHYSDQPPWPVAADGTGHSLVLARPSYGENNPKAWAASAFKGGSPGGPDPVPTGPLENIVINEILAHTDLPLTDYVELFNNSPLSVDLSGCWLSDDPTTNKFRIPDGTGLAARGFIAFEETQLGFALQADGETLYLVNSNQTRVLDALRFGGQGNGVAFGRYPDGAPDFRRLGARTSGTTNAPPTLRDIVIN